MDRGELVNMKRGVFCFGFALAVTVLAVSSQAAPRLKIDAGEFNFGYVPQNSKISHVFWLKSAGDDTLKILKVVPG